MRANALIKKAIITLFVLGLAWRIYVAIHYQSRAWVDEVWVVLGPAYQMLTGVGTPGDDWGLRVRSWVPASLLFVFLKALSWVGINDGLRAISAVRIMITLSNALSFVVFAALLHRRFQLRYPPLLVIGILFFIPELVHYGSLAELSVLGMPWLLAGLTAALWDEERTEPSTLTRVGAVLLSFSCLIRFQFGIIPVALVAWWLVTRKWRRAAELAGIGVVIFLLEVAFDSWRYGQFVVPIWNYFTLNTTGGVAAKYGVTPFYFGFEIFWRFVTEPVFVLVVATSVFAVRRAPFLTVVSWLFFLVHCFIGHKEYRFFYGAAVLLPGVAAGAFQKWCEERLAQGKQRWPAILTVLFVVGFVGAGTWRSVNRVAWTDFQYPAKLETLAGMQDDLRGLITYGWGGVRFGSNYTLYRPVPYVFTQSHAELLGRKLRPSDYSHVVTTANENPPCAKKIAEEGGAVLYSCTQAELERLLRPG